VTLSHEEREFHYSGRVLAADYARSAVGLIASAGPLLLAQPAWLPALFLSAAAAVFLVYFARTVCRQLTRVVLDEAGISATGPLGARIRWDSLCALRLDYYSTRGDREEGWMQLKLLGTRGTIRIDSEIERFAELVRVAAAAALERGLSIDPASRANLDALRIPSGLA
jgi:hypothetical protein